MDSDPATADRSAFVSTLDDCGRISPGDELQAAHLLGAHYFKPAIWKWQFERSSESAGPIALHSRDGRLVAFNGFMPISVLINGNRTSAAWSCDFVVSPEFRRSGVGRRLKEILDTKSGFLLALGTSQAAAPVLARSGWIPLVGPSTLNYLRAMHGPRGVIRGMLQAVLRMFFRPLRMLGKDRRVVTISSVPPSNSQLDQLWDRVSKTYCHCVVRDAAYLEWRYKQHPLAKYEYIAVGSRERDSRLVAIAVVRHGVDRSILVDYVGPRHDFLSKMKITSALMEWSSNARAIECTTSDRQLKLCLLTVGALPSGSGFHRFFVRSADAQAKVRSSDSWFLMGGDSDGEFLSAARDGCWVVREWSEEEFASSREQWEKLLSNSSADPLFMGWHWQFYYWKHFAAINRLTLRLIVVYDYLGDLVAIAPFCERVVTLGWGKIGRRLEPLGNLWRGPVTMRSEYLGLIMKQGSEREIARRIWSYVRDSVSWDDLVIQDWKVDDIGFDELNRTLKRECQSIDLAEGEVDAARFVPLGDGLSTYVESLSAGARRSMFNRRKFLDRLGKVTVEHASVTDVHVFLDELNRLHSSRWGGAVFIGPRLAFHLELARSLGSLGRLALSRVVLDGQVISVLYNLRAGNREYNLQMGFDDSFYSSKMSLGMLHIGYAIEKAAEDGMVALDLLAGGGRLGLFKQRIAPGRVQFARVRLMRNSIRAVAQASLSSARRAMSRYRRTQWVRPRPRCT